MSLAGASQQATRRLTVLQTRDNVLEQVATAKRNKRRGIDTPIELTTRSLFGNEADLTVFYRDEMRSSRWFLIIIGRTINRERVKLYVPTNPEEAIEAALPN